MKKHTFFKNRSTLQFQLLSRFFLILIVLFFIFEVIQYSLMRGYLYNNRNMSMQAKFHTINLRLLANTQSVNNLDDSIRDAISDLMEFNNTVSLIDSSGNIIMDSSSDYNNVESSFRDNGHNHRKRLILTIPKLSKSDYVSILSKQGNIEHEYKIVKDANNTQMVTWRKIGAPDNPIGLIQISTSIDDINAILVRQLYIYLGGLILILLCGYIIAGTVFKKTLNPLYKMKKTVEGITIGDLHTRINENNGISEIDSLSKSFNKMLNGLEISFENEQRIKEQMRQFVSDASHELKTPLTSIHGFVEVLLLGAAKNEQQLNTSLKTILNESERLSKLVYDLLTITKLDQNLPIEFKSENINAVINEIYPQLKILAGNRRIEVSTTGDLNVMINKDKIKQVILNLTQNAISYTDKQDGVINISTGTETKDNMKYVVMRISDNGAGIAQEHLDKIFNRFYRGEYHRSREHGGYGLGLSIVKSIVDAHGGIIEVKSTKGEGTQFEVYLKV